MRVNKRGIASATVVFVASIMAACGSGSDSSDEGSDKQVNIAFFNASTTNTYTAATAKGIAQEAGKVDAKVTTFNANFDPTTQISQVQDATATGKFDIYIVAPLNSAGLVPVAKQARDKGIEVATILNPIGTDIAKLESSVDGVITVGHDLRTMGKSIATLVIEACGDTQPCKVAYMPGDSKQATDQVRTAALKSELKTKDNIDLVAEQAGGFDIAAGLATSQNILTANPDLDVIAGASAQPIAGAVQAVAKAGLEGKVKVVSQGATVQDIEGIVSGKIFGAAVSLPKSEGALATKYAIEAFQGKDVTETTNIIKKSPVGPIITRKVLETDAGKKFTGEWSSN